MTTKSEVFVRDERDPTTVLDEVAAAAGPSVRLGAAVIEKLSQAIMEGRLQPGDSLPSEARIAAAFGVSKQIAREAVRDIAAMGLLQIQQGKATRVRALSAEPLGRFFRFAIGPSAEGLQEAIELRRVLEPPVARLAAERATDAGVARLETALATMERNLADVPEFVEADLDFHGTLAEMTNNRLLQLQMRALRPLIREVMELFNARRSRGPAEWRATWQKHAAVLAAVRGRDPEAAFRAMSEHFGPADAAVGEILAERRKAGASRP